MRSLWRAPERHEVRHIDLVERRQRTPPCSATASGRSAILRRMRDILTRFSSRLPPPVLAPTTTDDDEPDDDDDLDDGDDEDEDEDGFDGGGVELAAEGRGLGLGGRAGFLSSPFFSGCCCCLGLLLLGLVLLLVFLLLLRLLLLLGSTRGCLHRARA
ncbi:hypothetical protein L1887_49534 [Cichorium endivia]|nr:hypothetical protein L1887_49534 [Cichorium endivia]